MRYGLIKRSIFKLLNLVATAVSVWLARCQPLVAWTLEQLKRGTDANIDLLDVPPRTITGRIMADEYPIHRSDTVAFHIEIVYPAENREWQTVHDDYSRLNPPKIHTNE